MVDGLYEIKLKTPMGVKKGTLKLEALGNVLTGYFSALGVETPIVDGVTEGDSFTFSGNIKTVLGLLAFDLKGEVDGENVKGEAKTKKGLLTFTGIRK